MIQRGLISVLALALGLGAGFGTAVAQEAKQAPKAPAPAKTLAKTPAKNAPGDPANALAARERLALQSDLAWTGVYNGLINGEASDRMTVSIKAWQKSQGAKETGALNPQERTALIAAAKAAQDKVGWRVFNEMGSGVRLGVPEKLVTKTVIDAAGTRFSSAQDTLVITLTRRRDAGITLASQAEREKTEPAGRKVEYSTVRPDFYVLSGVQGPKKFYVRGQIRNGEVRTMTVLYDQAMEGTMAPVVVAMSSAFNPFPSAADAAPARKLVEYSTGTVVTADGAILTNRSSVDGCSVITVSGFGNAARVAEDAGRDLALVRLYGVKTSPLAIGISAAPGANVVVTGIADPQAQNGGASVSTLALQASRVGADIATLSPAPSAGFLGAPAMDNAGKFSGVVVARFGAPALSGAESVRAFLSANGIAPSGDAADPKSSVVRLICART